jgi:predicted AAA+ superfamily ATPase
MLWVDRGLAPMLQQSFKTRPVTLLTGPRQTGKSSLLQKILPDAAYISFDNLRQLAMAKENPEQFLAQFSTPVILDEIQYAPELFRSLKIMVDENRDDYGRWVLTGSEQFSLMSNVSETLAGRMSILQLNTLSAQELRNSHAPVLNNFIWKGGYPELWHNPDVDPTGFFDDYIRTYIERDLRNILEINKLFEFQRFFRILASRVGSLLNYSDIAKDVGVSDSTIRQWVHALETSGIVYLLPPYFSNVGKRLVKSPKIFFADHGLVCYLLDIKNNKDWQESINKGHLWENLVFMELMKTLPLRPGVDLFFYRDHQGIEIDFVFLKKEKVYLIEAKTSVNAKKLHFDKVSPLFENRTIKNIVAANIVEKTRFELKDYVLLNPMYQEIVEI